jgi:hypothetical protein
MIRWHPFINAETTDYSGLGRTLTGGAGATTETGPPISWRPGARILTVPWDPATTVWYAHYDTTSGELLSVGTVLPDPVPAGTTILELLGQPDLSAYEWNPLARTFLSKEGLVQVDRTEDLVADASLSSAWASLDATQENAMKTRVGQMLGPHRIRYDFQPTDLE